MSAHLNILAEAIQDTGYWRWWAAEYPDTFQLEFGGVQLYNSPQQPDQPPSSLLALRFTNPISVTFITYKDSSPDFPPDWPDQLQNDLLEPLSITYDSLTFNNSQSLRDMSLDILRSDTRFGTSLDSEEIAPANIILAFRAGPVGLIVAAQTLTILNTQGEIKPEEIEQKHNEWWAYWQEYWKLKVTDKALPIDYACEVTIPVTE